MKILKEGCPSKDGFHMPAEYEPHKGTILIWYKHLHCSLIENLTISLYGYRIRYLIESDCEGEDYDGNDYSPQTDEARRNLVNHVPHLLTSQLDII